MLGGRREKRKLLLFQISENKPNINLFQQNKIHLIDVKD
jgi:hypothetical protein